MRVSVVRMAWARASKAAGVSASCPAAARIPDSMGAIGKGRPIPHEGWYFTAGYYYLFGHYYASRVINQLDEPDRARFRTWLIDMMVKYQDPGGSWFDFPLYGYHKCYGAAFGCLTLQECGIE